MADITLYQKLKRLFSTNVIVRNVGGKKLKVIDTQAIQKLGLGGPTDRYNRLYSKGGLTGWGYDAAVAFQAQRKMLFRDYEIMDNDPIINCIHGDTRVATLAGFETIKNLSEKYSSGEVFEVWCWDSKRCQITIGHAHHPRKTGIKEVIEIELDNREIFKCTEDHRILLIDGTYTQAGKLQPGQSLMPFQFKKKEYLMIKSNGKYKRAHRYIYEDIFDKNVNGKPIHHINHNKYDNRTNNLIEMTVEDHAKYHGYSPIAGQRKGERWIDERKLKQSNRTRELFKNEKYRENFSKLMSKVMNDENVKNKISRTVKKLWKNDKEYRRKSLSGWKRWQASAEGKKFMSEHTSRLNRKRWANDEEYVRKMTKIFANHAKKLWENKEWAEWKRKEHSRIIKLKFANDPEYRKNVGSPGEKNGNSKHVISTESILVEGLNYKTLSELAENFDLKGENIKNKKQFLIRRLKSVGFKNWDDYKQNYQYSNHKIAEIRRNGEVVDVYDLTVDFFENFCLENGLIVSNSALDIYADESTVKNEMGELLRITSDNEKVKDVLDNLFYDILNIEFNLSPWIRQLCKYGDFFLELQLSKGYGITGIRPVSVYEVRREEGGDPVNPDFVKFVIEGGIREPVGKRELENFEMAHFRLISDSNYLPYGKSMIEGARRAWKQLSLMEDAMLIHRIMRAPEKRVFRIDVGNIPPNQVDQFMQSVINKIKKTPYIDPQTGDYNLKYNIQNLTEDFYLPVRGGDSGTNIENLPGLEYNSTDDIEYVRDKMMAALKVPRAFLNYEDQVGCIIPETKIPLLNGTEKTVKELIDDYKSGIKNYVYSIDEKTHKIVPGEIEWAGYTRKNAELVRITLDNGEYIDCTPDHKFLTRDGVWVQAKALKQDQSLMPLYLSKTTAKKKKGYYKVYHPRIGRYDEVHRLVSEYYGLVEPKSGKVVHHKDLNKTNNYPENLDCSMNYWEHRRYHQKMRIGTGRGTYKVCLNKNCNNKFYVLPKGIKKYCCLGCYHKNITGKEKGRKPLVQKICLYCNETFFVRYDNERKFCSRKCFHLYNRAENTYNTKFTELDFEYVVRIATTCSSLKQLAEKLGFCKAPLYKFFKYHSLNREEFVYKYMPLALANKVFMSRLGKLRGTYRNHKVVSVELLKEVKDTCDITIKKFHNFAVSAGVIVHNSKATLAAEDVRFARTIERLQRIVVSELWKIAIVHLYIQGFTDEDLVSFDLQLTNPSTIYEQEKVELWNSKVALARDIQETKLLPTEWTYKNIFGLAKQEIKEARKNIVKDLKRNYRHEQIEQEGNDPAESGQAVNDDQTTDMSMKEGKNLSFEDLEEIDSTDGRRGKKFRTRYKDDPFGDDPIGQKEYEKVVRLDKGLNRGRKFKRNSPLALTGMSPRKVKEMKIGLGKYKTGILNEKKDSLLDENNILDIGDK